MKSRELESMEKKYWISYFALIIHWLPLQIKYISLHSTPFVQLSLNCKWLNIFFSKLVFYQAPRVMMNNVCHFLESSHFQYLVFLPIILLVQTCLCTFLCSVPTAALEAMKWSIYFYPVLQLYFFHTQIYKFIIQEIFFFFLILYITQGTTLNIQ